MHRDSLAIDSERDKTATFIQSLFVQWNHWMMKKAAKEEHPGKTFSNDLKQMQNIKAWKFKYQLKLWLASPATTDISLLNKQSNLYTTYPSSIS